MQQTIDELKSSIDEYGKQNKITILAKGAVFMVILTIAHQALQLLSKRISNGELIRCNCTANSKVFWVI